MRAVPSLLQTSQPLNTLLPVIEDNVDKYPDELNQRDYPMVNFWRLQDWKDSEAREELAERKSNPKGAVQASKGINVATLYIEDEDGNPITGYQATEMRSVAYHIFQELVARKIAPLTWGIIRGPASKYYHREMNAAFPILGLCTNRWKGDKLASKIYSSWYGTHGKVVHQLKSEDNELDNTSPVQRRSRRQRRHSSKSPSRKKAKTEKEGIMMGLHST